jgi:hypothetical protein
MIVKFKKKRFRNFFCHLCMETLVTNSCQKVAQTYYCEKCDYHTSKKSSFDKHNETKKHKVTLSDVCHEVGDAKVAYPCKNCDKVYYSRNGLWVHKKTCKIIVDKPEQSPLNDINIAGMTDKDLIIMLIKENKDLQSLLVEHAREYKDDIKNMMMEVLKNGTSNTTNSNNTNTNCMNNNKTFNLQFFLNETCKDAMNITDFVDSIKVQLSDLERFGEIGYVENLSNIITTNLKALDVTERPVHCTDKKRETIYIKDEDKWEKEDDNRTKLRKAIKKIAAKNYKLLPEYREKYPGCQYADSKYSDKYNKTVVEAMCAQGNEAEKEDKIIKNISKNIVIDKQEI